MNAGRVFPPGRFDYFGPLISRLSRPECRDISHFSRNLPESNLMETSPESSEHSGQRVSSFPAELRPAGAGRTAPRGQGLCLGTLVRLDSCHLRLAVPTQRRRGGTCAERSPCNAAARHQRIPALPARHGKDRVLAVDACAERPRPGDAQRRRCGAPGGTGEPLRRLI